MRALALALVALLALPALAPAGSAQLPPLPEPVASVGRVVEENATSVRESYVGPELSREDIDVRLDMGFREVDFDTVNVIFGGGTFSAEARIDAVIDMRVLGASRVQQALDAAAPGSGNLTALGMDPRTSFIPADVFRMTFAPEVIKSFEEEQEEKLADFLRATIPNVSVLNTEFDWVNVSPQDSYEGATEVPTGAPQVEDVSVDDYNDPTEPPITLHAVVDVRYVETTSLLDILDKALRPQSDAEKERKKEVADAAAGYERSAFGLLGIRQVLDLKADEGWDVVMTVRLPEGYTFEEASPDVRVAQDLREARIATLARDADDTVLNPVSLTLSNRFLVSVALLASVLLVGNILRFPVLLATNAWRRRMRT